jgi:hypothetical protein
MQTAKDMTKDRIEDILAQAKQTKAGQHDCGDMRALV